MTNCTFVIVTTADFKY